MKSLIPQMDWLRLAVLLISLLPLLALFILGFIWLWQNGQLIFWLVAMIGCAMLGYGLQRWLVQRDRKLLSDPAAEPNPEWPPSADAAWKQVVVLADNCRPEDWPLEQGTWVLALGQKAMETVAHCYHPDADKPLYELTIPHTLLIIERASRDLRLDVAEKIPFSNRLTIGDFFRIQRWTEKAEQLFKIYRAGSILVNPVNALLGEVWRLFRERSFNQARDELHRWFLRAYVYKVGYYAIDLYSGRLPLGEEQMPQTATPETQTDLAVADRATKAAVEPLRILVLGRANAGKSSLINALFGELTAAADVLSDTTRTLQPYTLIREGLTQALIFDSPGCDSSFFDSKQMLIAAGNADLIIWVTPADRPDRQSERQFLDALHSHQSVQMDRRPAPLLAAASFIDRLRPVNEWHPPYDLTDTGNAKAVNINAAIRAVAADLAVPVERVIPVCLQHGSVYNVNDTLWAVILNHQDEALRVRLMRCLDARKHTEDWMLLRRQMAGAGRFLRDLPEILGKRTPK
ncbi:MAG: 50S ribosome-binding GTPase [Nitrosomonas sp.]|nr:MAG: 50S ribosome-binding GTPase [Nitrosomonas sp.]